MLPKNVSEDEVAAVFSEYGTIKDLHILRGSQKTSKGCAFIKYETKEQALAALDALNGKHKVEDQVVAGIEARIVAWTFLPAENGESIQILLLIWITSSPSIDAARLQQEMQQNYMISGLGTWDPGVDGRVKISFAGSILLIFYIVTKTICFKDDRTSLSSA